MAEGGTEGWAAAGGVGTEAYAAAGVAAEPALHYFVSGRDEWATGADEWPPAGLAVTSFPLAAFVVQPSANVRAHAEQTDNAAKGGAAEVATVVAFQVDFSATSGVVSRWNLVQHLMKKAVTYPDRAAQGANNLVLELGGAPLPGQGLEIVGSPVVSLSLALVGVNATDAAVFVYLEERDPRTGAVQYITEAALRVSHRATESPAAAAGKSAETAAEAGGGGGISQGRPGAFDSVRRTFSDQDMRAFAPGEFTRVELVLEPIAYVVPPGRLLRVVLAGADAENFYLGSVPGLARAWEVNLSESELRVPTREPHDPPQKPL